MSFQGERYVQEGLATLKSIANSLERIAKALETQNEADVKESDGSREVTAWAFNGICKYCSYGMPVRENRSGAGVVHIHLAPGKK